MASCWDLHVAIQAMGWKDCHLEFRLFDEATQMSCRSVFPPARRQRIDR